MRPSQADGGSLFILCGVCIYGAVCLCLSAPLRGAGELVCFLHPQPVWFRLTAPGWVPPRLSIVYQVGGGGRDARQGGGRGEPERRREEGQEREWGEVRVSSGGGVSGKEKGRRKPGRAKGVPGKRKVPGRGGGGRCQTGWGEGRQADGRRGDTRQGGGGMPGKGRRGDANRSKTGTAKQGRPGCRRGAAARRLLQRPGDRAARVAHLLPRDPGPERGCSLPARRSARPRRLRRCSPERGRRRERLQRARSL